VSAATAITFTSKARRNSPDGICAVGPSGSTVAALFTSMSTRAASSAAATARLRCSLIAKVSGNDPDLVSSSPRLSSIA
jgi:hypothetical protein